MQRRVPWEVHRLCIQQFGPTKVFVDMVSGKRYLVPTRDVLEKGIRQQDLKNYPEVP